MRRPRSDRMRPNDRRPYKVGYRHPPKHSRYKPGQSGNPSGRPRYWANPRYRPGREGGLRHIVLEELWRPIAVNGDKKRDRVPAIQVMIRRAFVSYMTKFDRASLRFFTELLRIYEREEQQKHDAGLKEAIEYKNYWENVLRERKRKGITGDDPIPHPDNVIIDFESGDFRIRGPMTKEERDEFVILGRALVRAELAQEGVSTQPAPGPGSRATKNAAKSSKAAPKGAPANEKYWPPKRENPWTKGKKR